MDLDCEFKKELEIYLSILFNAVENTGSLVKKMMFATWPRQGMRVVAQNLAFQNFVLEHPPS